MKPIIILLILILSYFYLSRKTPNYEVLFMIFILIIAGSNHILEGVKSKKSKKSKDPPIPSLDDSDFAEKAYNYHKKVTCGSKGAKKASELFKEINNAPEEKKDEIRKKYDWMALFWAGILNDEICVKKTMKTNNFEHFGKKKNERGCEDITRTLSTKDKVPKEVQNLNKKYLAFANKTYCS